MRKPVSIEYYREIVKDCEEVLNLPYADQYYDFYQIKWWRHYALKRMLMLQLKDFNHM